MTPKIVKATMSIVALKMIQCVSLQGQKLCKLVLFWFSMFWFAKGLNYIMLIHKIDRYEPCFIIWKITHQIECVN
jgi:hypothetical protein